MKRMHFLIYMAINKITIIITIQLLYKTIIIVSAEDDKMIIIQMTNNNKYKKKFKELNKKKWIGYSNFYL